MLLTRKPPDSENLSSLIVNIGRIIQNSYIFNITVDA